MTTATATIDDGRGFTATVPAPQPAGLWRGLDDRDVVPESRPLMGWRLWWMLANAEKWTRRPNASRAPGAQSCRA